MVVMGWTRVIMVREAIIDLKSFLKTYEETIERVSLPAPQGYLKVTNMSYTDPNTGAVLLKDINFNIGPGNILVVLGQSGSGKSTLLKILAGVEKVTSGSVRLDGAEISKWNKEELNPYIGYLPQEIEVFGGDVVDNITRFREVDDTKLKNACDYISLSDVYESFKNGVRVKIDTDGHTLSGGKKQKIGIARALYGDPKYIIFDEPTSKLDNPSELEFIQSVKRIKAEKAITKQELQVDYDKFELQERRRETALRRKRLSQLGLTVSERRKNALAAKQRRTFELMQNSSVRKAMELDAFLGSEGFTNDRIVKAIRKVNVLDRRIEVAQIKGQLKRADLLLLERENILKKAGIKKKKFFRSTKPLSLKPLSDPITPADVRMYDEFGIDVDPKRRSAANAQVVKDMMDDFEKGPPQKPMTKRQARIDKGMDELLDEVLKPEQTPGQIFARGGKKAGKRTLLKIFGKKGLKLIARIPVIGPIVDFGLNLAFGDPPGRAASKAIFAGIFGGLGAAIGSIVPVVGTIIGGILGGVGGDIVGGMLYDMVAGRLGLSTEIGQGIIPPTTGFIESAIKNVGGLVQGVTDSISGTAKILDKSSKPRADKPFSMPDSVSSDKEFLSEVDNLAKKYNV